jgi:hypothetical protein
MIKDLPKIICVCGNVYMEDLTFVGFQEEDKGNICIYNFEDYDDKVKDLFFKKIDLAGELLVANLREEAYGDSAKEQVKYAVKTGKPVRWYNSDRIPENWI